MRIEKKWILKSYLEVIMNKSIQKSFFMVFIGLILSTASCFGMWNNIRAKVSKYAAQVAAAVRSQSRPSLSATTIAQKNYAQAGRLTLISPVINPCTTLTSPNIENCAKPSTACSSITPAAHQPHTSVEDAHDISKKMNAYRKSIRNYLVGYPVGTRILTHDYAPNDDLIEAAIQNISTISVEDFNYLCIKVDQFASDALEPLSFSSRLKPILNNNDQLKARLRSARARLLCAAKKQYVQDPNTMIELLLHKKNIHSIKEPYYLYQPDLSIASWEEDSLTLTPKIEDVVTSTLKNMGVVTFENLNWLRVYLRNEKLPTAAKQIDDAAQNHYGLRNSQQNNLAPRTIKKGNLFIVGNALMYAGNSATPENPRRIINGIENIVDAQGNQANLKPNDILVQTSAHDKDLACHSQDAAKDRNGIWHNSWNSTGNRYSDMCGFPEYIPLSWIEGAQNGNLISCLYKHPYTGRICEVELEPKDRNPYERFHATLEKLKQSFAASPNYQNSDEKFLLEEGILKPNPDYDANIIRSSKCIPGPNGFNPRKIVQHQDEQPKRIDKK